MQSQYRTPYLKFGVHALVVSPLKPSTRIRSLSTAQRIAPYATAVPHITRQYCTPHSTIRYGSPAHRGGREGERERGREGDQETVAPGPRADTHLRNLKPAATKLGRGRRMEEEEECAQVWVRGREREARRKRAGEEKKENEKMVVLEE
eukprot:1201923-Rhodomonas_salina.1